MPSQEVVDRAAFNSDAELPYSLRIDDFALAMQDVYDFFFDVNSLFHQKGLPRLEEVLRAANMSGTLSDMLTASLARHSRTLCQNNFHNGHPDLIVHGRYERDSIKAGEDGVEIKTTRKPGGAVDTHGARDQWMCVFVYQIDKTTEPAQDRRATRFTEVYLAHVTVDDFRRNARGELGTRTATLHAEGIKKLRRSWVYLERSQPGNSLLSDTHELGVGLNPDARIAYGVRGSEGGPAPSEGVQHSPLPKGERGAH